MIKWHDYMEHLSRVVLNCRDDISHIIAFKLKRNPSFHHFTSCPHSRHLFHLELFIKPQQCRISLTLVGLNSNPLFILPPH